MINIKPIHPFPARMAPSIAWSYLMANKRMRVLDPMVGSGTTLTIARYLGHEAYGIDTDPLAVTISSTWSNNIDEDLFLEKAAKVLEKGKLSSQFLNNQTSFLVFYGILHNLDENNLKWNVIMAAKSTISVFVRVKPTHTPSKLCRIDPEQNAIFFTVPIDAHSTGPNHSRGGHAFKFDDILDMEAQQKDIFEKVAVPSLNRLV